MPNIPVWVSRPTHDGLVASFSIPRLLLSIIGWALVANVVVWAIIGLVTAALLVIP